MKDLLKLAGKPGSPRRIRLYKVGSVVQLVVIVCIIKAAAHYFGLEKFEVNQLFSAMVASTVFLMGFLLSGVLTDFKESEKIPGEIATSLESLYREIVAIRVYNPQSETAKYLEKLVGFGDCIVDWFYDRAPESTLYGNYAETHLMIAEASAQIKGDASTLRGRLMADMALILQRVNRVQVIRDTDFVPLVYWMAYIAAALLVAGLVLAKSENLSASIFFLAVISFLVILLLRLIDDIDNPFGFSDQDSAEDVSIQILIKTIERLRNSLFLLASRDVPAQLPTL
jgi:predicted membrane chloride channel (bestrophin family)